MMLAGGVFPSHLGRIVAVGLDIIHIRRQPVGQILPHLNIFPYGDETLCKIATCTPCQR
jgi:uncharacterized membrane protein YqgA involved in biofilm formation